MAIVTASLNRQDHHSLLVSNKQDYADLHGYDLIVIEEILAQDGSNASIADIADPDARVAAAMFTKPLAILKALSTGEYEWVWWLDLDALIMERSLKLDRLLPLRSTTGEWLADAVFSGDPNLVINAGSMLLRNCEWSVKLLTRQYQSRNDIRIPHLAYWHDNAVIAHMFNTNGEVRRRSLLLPQRALNSFHSDFVPGDFVIHFAGGSASDKINLMHQYLDRIAHHRHHLHEPSPAP